jgi:hypothetical protein
MADEPGVRSAPAIGPAVDFRRDVYPILATRCFKCHEGAGASSGVRLDDRALLVHGAADQPPLVRPGDAAGSRLMELVAGRDPDLRMPLEGEPLVSQQQSVLRAWIDQGVAWDNDLLPPLGPGQGHWAFQPIRRPPLPVVKNAAWAENPIDLFIAAAHEKHGLQPLPPASRRTLIRRLYLDLVGLPPAPEDVVAFERDPSPLARESLVERLLASPHYGERWGRHWLDVARYAESEGYESNHPRPFAWRYRDHVVQSFNGDQPLAEFVRQQIAGDELVPYSDENLIATGFLAAARISSNEEDKLLQRNDVLVDVVNATGNAFLGLTVQCAQCHDHKFDPLSQMDYYRLLAFFTPGQPNNFVLRDEELWRQHNLAKPTEYDALAELKAVIYERGRQRRIAEAKQRLTPEERRALEIPAESRTRDEELLARQAMLTFQFTPDGIERGIPEEDRPLYHEVKKKLAGLEKTVPPAPQAWAYYSPVTSPHDVPALPQLGFYPLPYEPEALAELRTYCLERGEVHQPREAVRPGFPEFLKSGRAPAAARTRRELADWICSRENPLTARVWVNRLWHYHFGRGLVATPGNFGLRGERPSHPELLDWLAAEFLDSGGRTKHIHRLIVNSQTYALASQPHAANQKIDPDNKLLWRWLPRRVEGESIRDLLLAAGGQLDTTFGGPSLPVEQHDSNHRRALYQFQKRDYPPELQSLFDGPLAMTESCSQRYVSTTAPGALYLLNSRFALECAAALAERATSEAKGDLAAQIERAWWLAVSRAPSSDELAACEQLVKTLRTQRALPIEAPEGGNEPAASWELTQLCHALLNLNEFVYIE